MRFPFTALLLLVVAPLGAVAGDDDSFRVSAGLGAFAAGPRLLAGRASFDEAAAESERLEFVRDLNLGRRTIAPAVELRFEVGVLGGLAASWFESNTEGTSTLDRAASFDGRSFLAGQRLKSRLEWSEWTVRYERCLFRQPGAPGASLYAGIGVLQGRARLNIWPRHPVLGGVDSLGDGAHGLSPLLSARFEGRIHDAISVSLAAHVAFPLRLRGRSVESESIEVSLKWCPIPYVALVGGWRLRRAELRFRGRESSGSQVDNRVLLVQEEPFVGIEISF